MSSEHCLVLSSCPDNQVAERIGQMLVERKLAACVNILPNVVSIYRWNDEIERSSEVLLLIKSTRTAYQPMEAAIREIHPYELPEIIMVPIDYGQPSFMKWISRCVTP